MKNIFKIFMLVVVSVLCINMTGTKVADSTYDQLPPRMTRKAGVDIWFTIHDGSKTREGRGLCANDGTYPDCATDEGLSELRVYYESSDLGETISFTRIKSIEPQKEGLEPKWVVKTITKRDRREEIKCFVVTLEILTDVPGKKYEKRECLVDERTVIGGVYIDTGGEMKPEFLYNIDVIRDMRVGSPALPDVI